MKIETAQKNINKGFQEAVKRAHEYNRVIETIGLCNTPIHSNSKVVKISERTPFNYNQAEALYNLSQEYNIEIDQLITTALSGGIYAHGIRAMLSGRVS